MAAVDADVGAGDVGRDVAGQHQRQAGHDAADLPQYVLLVEPSQI